MLARSTQRLPEHDQVTAEARNPYVVDSRPETYDAVGDFDERPFDGQWPNLQQRMNDHLERRLLHMRFEPAGFTANTDIPRVSSLADYLARRLADYLDPDSRAELHLDA
jgi:hypothetical protein